MCHKSGKLLDYPEHLWKAKAGSVFLLCVSQLCVTSVTFLLLKYQTSSMCYFLRHLTSMWRINLEVYTKDPKWKTKSVKSPIPDHCSAQPCVCVQSSCHWGTCGAAILVSNMALLDSKGRWFISVFTIFPFCCSLCLMSLDTYVSYIGPLSLSHINVDNFGILEVRLRKIGV